MNQEWLIPCFSFGMDHSPTVVCALFGIHDLQQLEGQMIYLLLLLLASSSTCSAGVLHRYRIILLSTVVLVPGNATLY
jgi:hypothetical protein